MSAAAARPSYAEASRTLLRDTVLDAVGELLEDRVFADVTMADVADRAGVSRQTLYNAFGSREELAQAYVIRESDGFLAAVAGEIETHESPHAALAASLELFLAAAETHPLVRAISAADEGDVLLALVTTRGGPVLDRVIEGLAQMIAANWPVVVTDSLPLADCFVRLAISHAALPSDTPKETGRTVARLLGPYLDQLLAEGA